MGTFNASFEFLEEIPKDLTLNHGSTIFAASGDHGASAGNDLEVPALKNTGCYYASNPLMTNHLIDAWPVTSPWVTSVDGMQVLATKVDPQTQVLSSGSTDGVITSGGGFAGPAFPQELFSMPAWQKTAAERYLTENNASTFPGFPTEDTPGFNPSGRAVPDMSTYSAMFPILLANGTVRLFDSLFYSQNHIRRYISPSNSLPCLFSSRVALGWLLSQAPLWLPSSVSSTSSY